MSELSVELIVIRRPGAAGLLDDPAIAAMVEHALRAEQQSGRWEISVVLVDDQELRALHRDFMAIDEPTDVMTFPAEADEERESGGDIVVSVDRAAEHGPEHGHTTEEELSFLIVHGVLHLCSWGDHSDADRAAMLARQTDILSSLTRGG